MSRLTPKDWKDQSNEIWLKLGNIHMGDESFRSFLSQSLQKLAHYEDLEEQGRLIELPCKVGDYVYKLTTKCDKHKCPPISCEVCDFDEQFVGIRKFKFSYECMYLLEKYLGDTVFLTKAEAEVKLAELEECDNQ